MAIILAALYIIMLQGGSSASNTGCPTGFFSINDSGCMKMFNDVRRNWTEAKAKCEAEELVMAAHTDDIAVELRKYLLDNYVDKSNVWLGASGSGSDMVWQDESGSSSGGVANQVVGRTNPLWMDEVEANYVATTHCLVLAVGEYWSSRSPAAPYASWPCSWAFIAYALCQVPGQGVATKPSTEATTDHLAAQVSGQGVTAKPTTDPIAAQVSGQGITTKPTQQGEDPSWCQYIPSMECSKYKIECSNRCQEDKAWCQHIPAMECPSYKTQCPNRCRQDSSTTAPAAMDVSQPNNTGTV